MVDELRLNEFDEADFFLRHVDKPRYLSGIRESGIAPAAFATKHATLSFTQQNEDLKTDEGLDSYQLEKALPSGDLPGLCKLSYGDLTKGVTPPLPPRRDPVSDDKLYGNLHCVTDAPTSCAQREQLAKLATRYGVVRQLIKKNKVAEFRARLRRLNAEPQAE